MRTIKLFLILAFILTVIHSVTAANVDSLLIVLIQHTSNEDQGGIINTHLTLANHYKKVENYKKAEHHFKEVIELAQVLKKDTLYAKSLFGLGEVYEFRNNFPEALECYTKFMELENVETGDLKKANAYSRICQIYQALGNYEKAFQMQMEALRLHEMDNDSLGMARAQYNIGRIFFYQKRFDQALEWYEKSKVICDALKIERYIYSTLAALGSVHAELGHPEKSLQYNIESLKLAEKLNYKTGIGYAMGNVASNYIAQRKFYEAEHLLEKAIQLKTELEDKWGAIGSYLGLGIVYLEWEKPNKAIPVINEALAMAKALGSKPRQVEAYKYLVQAYEQIGILPMAYEYQKQYVALKDSLLSEKTVEEMGQSKRRYEIQKREHEITLLKKENELLGKDKKIQKLQIYIFAIAAIFLMIFSGWFLKGLKYQRSMNNLLEEKNETLNLKNDEIHIKNKLLENSNQDLQQFAYVASHDLKEPLRMIHSYTSLLEKRYNEIFDNTGKEFMHYIVDAVGRMETLLDDLLDYSRVGNQKAPTKLVDVGDVMIMVEANLRYKLESLNAQLHINEANMPAIKAHRTQLVQLLQNLISNGVKFKGEKDPVVTVDCKRENNLYVFSVKDNGIGISKENLQKVFEMFRRLHTREEYEGTGIGLATCKRIVNNFGGDIWVESEVGDGSTFFFSVPCPVNEAVLAS